MRNKHMNNRISLRGKLFLIRLSGLIVLFLFLCFPINAYFSAPGNAVKLFAPKTNTAISSLEEGDSLRIAQWNICHVRDCNDGTLPVFVPKERGMRIEELSDDNNRKCVRNCFYVFAAVSNHFASFYHQEDEEVQWRQCRQSGRQRHGENP